MQLCDKRQLRSEKQLAGATAMEEKMITTTVNSLFPMNKRMKCIVVIKLDVDEYNSEALIAGKKKECSSK